MAAVPLCSKLGKPDTSLLNGCSLSFSVAMVVAISKAVAVSYGKEGLLLAVFRGVTGGNSPEP